VDDDLVRLGDRPLELAPVPAPTSGRGVVEAFLAGRTTRTLQAYTDDLRLWAAWLGPAVPVDAAVEQLLQASAGEAHRQVLAYRASMVERKLSSATINRRLAALRSLVRLARMLGLVVWSLEVPGLRLERMRDTRGPGVPAVRRMLRAAALQEPAKAARDTALLRLMFDLALRRAEVLAVDVADLDLERSAMWVWRKGKRERKLLSLPKATSVALTAWLEQRGSAAGALFGNFDRSGKGGGRLSGEGLYSVVQMLGAKAKAGRVRPHGLRHTAITRAMEEAGRLGIPIEEVLAYSGHSKRSLPLLLEYRDNLRDRQGELATLVAGGAGD
jgi:integrase/recombinase XerC